MSHSLPRTLNQEVEGGMKKQEVTWWRKDNKGAGRKNRGGEADDKKVRAQEQVRELLSKVEDVLQENGASHFSLHMYQRLEKEWSRREQQLRARLEAETGVGSERRQQTTAEAKINMEPEEEQGLETEEDEWGGSLRKEQEHREGCVQRKLNKEGDEEQRVRAELERQSSQKDGEDAGCDSGGEKEEEGEATMKRESTEGTTRMMA
ncbi:golgin subfamily A member 6-like protein 6 [Scophthalmus maximus]|uniref:golgin subfamily A member 6-like protein 6 n=1 Tax=Scophthalmus maximus TaxID=52904 RepID=UPI001FA81F34|nr:golgin subfamily A member 6-like protein 6 [Scophthalmus maximus]